MLTKDEQSEIVKAALKLSALMAAYRTKSAKGAMSAKAVLEANKRAEDNLRDFLKEL